MEDEKQPSLFETPSNDPKPSKPLHELPSPGYSNSPDLLSPAQTQAGLSPEAIDAQQAVNKPHIQAARTILESLRDKTS